VPAPTRLVAVATALLALVVAAPATAHQPTSTTGTAPAAAAMSAPGARDTVKIRYPGRGVVVRRGSGDEQRLTGAPRSLKRFVRARLDTIWKQSGSRPRCATAPTVVVERYHGAGFASVAEGVYNPCPGGGNRATYVFRNGRWRAVLGTQEVLPCADQQWFAVPRFIAGRQCATEGEWDLVPYQLGTYPRSSPEASARRLAGFPLTPRTLGIPASGYALRAAADKVRADVKRGAYFSPAGCGVGGDGSAAGEHLEPGAPGCLLRASWDRNSYAVLYAVPMVVTPTGVYRATELIPVAST